MMTVTSLSNNVKEEHRSAPFYKKYEYRICFDLIGANMSYYCDTINDLDDRMLNRGQSYASCNMDRMKLAMFIHWRVNNCPRYSKNNTMLVSPLNNQIRIYTNDIAIATEVKNLGFTGIVVTKAIVSIPTGVMEFARPPKHKFRCYFKSKRVTDDFRQSVVDFLKQYSDVVPCKGLVRWIKQPNRWTSKWLSSSFFVDYDNDSMKTLILLMFSNQYIGKHYELKKR